MINLFRNIFRIRQKRTPQPAGPSPRIGETIVRQNVKIKVLQTIPSDLWEWLMLSGWRVNTYRHDRRKYVKFASGVLMKLSAVSAEKRAEVHARLIDKANKAP